MTELVLSGGHIRLEPLQLSHVGGLVGAASVDRSLYQWTPVPRTEIETQRYIETALAWQESGTAIPFATIRKQDGQLIGSTRFWNIERWPWPEGHARAGRTIPDACEIGYTWLTAGAIRTVANTEAKFLMLAHAFESWQVLRVCFHTDVRNSRSRAALERIGATYEGVLRAHRFDAVFSPRDSVRYSILATEWAEVKHRLQQFL
jgi:N-acetyltransferase